MKIQRINVPEWGGDVCLRPLPLRARIRLDSLDGDPTLFILVNCLCDEQGNPLYTEAGIPALATKSFAVLARLRDEAAKLSGIHRTSLDERIQAMYRSPVLVYTHELAERLTRTVDELCDAIDSADLTDWKAYDSVHLSDEWYQTAQISYYLCHINGKPRKKLKIKDFLPRRARRISSDDQFKASMSVFMAVANGKPSNNID